MRELFLSEWRRCRGAALIAAAVHMVLLLFINRMVDLLQMPWSQHAAIVFLYMLLGLAFGLYQFVSYRQPGRWVWLLHRPLPLARIYLAIFLASACLISLAIGLPTLLAVLGTDVLSNRVVDQRHYLLVVHTVALSLAAWLAGSYMAMARSRSAIVVLVLPALLLTHQASAWVMLAPTLLSLALLGQIAITAFQPNRQAPPKTWPAWIATALPLQLGFYFALSMGLPFAYQNLQILMGTHPLNTSVAPAGGFIEASRANGRALLISGLAQATDARAALWRRQIALTEIANFEAQIDQFPVRNQLSNRAMLRWSDEARHIDWTFSHDAMRYVGRDSYTGAARGSMGEHGVDDSAPFPAPPLSFDQGYLLTPTRLYQVDPASARVVTLARYEQGEQILGPPNPVGELLYVVSNRRLIAYTRAIPLVERFSVALPGPIGDLDRIDVAPLLDSTLMSFTFGRRMNEGWSGATQTVVLVDQQLQAHIVAQRALTHDFAPLFEHISWWVSPVLHAALTLPAAMLDEGSVTPNLPATIERPRQVWLAALLCLLAAGAGIATWLRNASMPMPYKAAWVIAGLTLGLPALFSLMVLQARPPSFTPRPQDGALPHVA